VALLTKVILSATLGTKQDFCRENTGDYKRVPDSAKANPVLFRKIKGK